MTQAEMGKVETLRFEMRGAFQQGDVALPFELNGEMELPDRAHGTFDAFEENIEFLRLGEEDFMAEPGHGFEIDQYDESGAVFLDLLRPLLVPGQDEPFTDLERQPDERYSDLERFREETLAEREVYHISFRMDMREFIERLTQEDLAGVEVKGQGELFIDQDTLMTYSLLVDCESCLIPIGEDMDLVVDFYLSDFNEPVHIPSPTDEPTLLPAPEPDDHGNAASSATPLLLDELAGGVIDPSGDVDFFSFEASAGQAYAVTVALGTLGDSTLTLYDTDGFSQLAFNDDYDFSTASQIVWTAPSDGTYYAAVEGWSEETGGYSLTLTIWTGPVPTPTPAPTATPAAPSTATPTPTPIATLTDFDIEFIAIYVAVSAMMVNNGIPSIPNPVTANTAPCTTGTQDMSTFPDVASDSANGGKVNDPQGSAYTFPGDKPGYVLFEHDITADGAATPTVNYLTDATTTYCYTVDSDGTVTQYLEDGTQTNS